MSQDIRAALVRYADAWSAGDIARIVACYHDEMTLYWGGANPLSGTHAGKPKALAALAAMAQRANRRLVRVSEIMAGETRGVLLTREAFTREGRSAEIDRVLVFSVKDALLHECWAYDQDQALIDWFLRD